MKKHGITIPLDALWDISNTLVETKVDISTVKVLGSIFDSSHVMGLDDASQDDSQLHRVRRRSHSQVNYSLNHSVNNDSPPVNET